MPLREKRVGKILSNGLERKFGGQRRAHGSETVAVDGRRAEPAKGQGVVGCAIAFVRRKIVLGKLFMDVDHPSVASDFGEDAGRRDGGAFPIASHHRFLNARREVGDAVVPVN